MILHGFMIIFHWVMVIFHWFMLLVCLLTLLCLIVGLVNPNIVLDESEEQKNRGKVVSNYLVTCIVCLCLSFIPTPAISAPLPAPPLPRPPIITYDEKKQDGPDSNTKDKVIETAIKDWKLKLVDVEHPGTTLKWSNYGDTKEASGTWLVVYVSLENTKSESSSLSPFNFRVTDSKGTIYNHYENLAITDVYARYRDGKSIANDILLPGSKANYYLLFDVSPDATGLKLEFTPSVIAKSEVIPLWAKSFPEKPAVSGQLSVSQKADSFLS